MPSRERVDAYKELKDKTHLLVSEINSKFSSFSSVPIVYVYRSVRFGLLRIASDGLLIASDCF